MGQWNQTIWGEAQAPAYKVGGAGWVVGVLLRRQGLDDRKWRNRALGADRSGWRGLPTWPVVMSSVIHRQPVPPGRWALGAGSCV